MLFSINKREKRRKMVRISLSKDKLCLVWLFPFFRKLIYSVSREMELTELHSGVEGLEMAHS